jgi:hypothetical protein
MQPSQSRRNETSPYVPITFDDIHEIVGRRTRLPNCDVHITDLVLAEDCFDFILIKVRERNRIRDRDPPLVLSSNEDCWGSFIQTDTKTFKFCFDELLVSKWFEDIQDDENEVTSAGD